VKKKQPKTPKPRNWLSLHAKGLSGRKGAGAHGKRGYVRHPKHKGKAQQ